MKEIEIKAHARKAEDIKKLFDSLYGEGKPVHKYDHYFRRPGASVQALRIREHKGIIELTTKKTSTSEAGEDNEEYEFQAPLAEKDRAIMFFHALGYEYFFIKKKDGWEWFADDAHVELLSVNKLGYFLEIEILLPFDSSLKEAKDAMRKIESLMEKAHVDKSDYEIRSYREMILESENGIQG